MKKLFMYLFIVAALAVAVPDAVGQDPTQDLTEYVTDGDFEKLFDKYTEKAVDGVQDLLKIVKENFTDEAQFVWDLAIKKQQLPFYISIVVLVLGLIILPFGFPLWKKAKEWASAQSYISPDECYNGIFAITLFVVGAGSIIGGVISGLVNLSPFLLPEYYVLQELVGLLR